MRRRSMVELVGLVVAAGALACTDVSGGAGGGAAVGLAFSTRPAPGGPASGAMSVAAAQAGDPTVVTLNGDSLIIDTVQLVLREIELKRIDVPSCPDSSGSSHDDGCEEFTVGIQLVSLPLGGLTERVITVPNVPAGMYDEVEFEIHKPEDSTDAAFIAANPLFARVSIRVTGEYRPAGAAARTRFVYTTDLNEEQEIQLVPPLDLTTDGAANVTIRIDVATWFLNGARTGLVDPVTANKGGSNENVVRDNIRQSIDAFHDDDSDGLDDHHEDDDHGTSQDHP